MLEIRRADERGSVNLGWLTSHHTFSFGNYHDPRQMGFSDLRVINDDWVQPGRGFDTHPHQDMEIFTYVLEGALQHRDSIGNGSLIRPGDVQMMSAGTGIRHSEFNPSASEAVHLLQIWIVPNRLRVEPRYQQSHFADSEKRGRLRLIISQDGADGSLSVYQDARVYAGLFDGDERATLNLGPARHAYVHLARGSLAINGQCLEAGDGARVRLAGGIEIAAGRGADVLIFDLRAKESSFL
jgi:redox-sensitive bicupin YhaK (pirin superfamily)